VLERLQATPPDQRREALAAFLSEQIGTVLGMGARPPDRRQGLFDMGMDSLIAVELKNRIQAALRRGLPATIAFDYPSIDALSSYLHGELFGGDPAPAAAGGPVSLEGETLGDVLAEVDHISDADALRALRDDRRRKQL
jgi:hypothetical protein